MTPTEALTQIADKLTFQLKREEGWEDRRAMRECERLAREASDVHSATRKVLTSFSWASNVESRDEAEFLLFHPGLIEALEPLDDPYGIECEKRLGVRNGRLPDPGSPFDLFVKEYREKFPAHKTFTNGMPDLAYDLRVVEVDGPFTVTTNDNAEVILEYNEQEWF